MLSSTHQCSNLSLFSFYDRFGEGICEHNLKQRHQLDVNVDTAEYEDLIRSSFWECTIVASIESKCDSLTFSKLETLLKVRGYFELS